MRKAAWVLTIVLLLGTGALGLYNGVTELTQGATALQRSVTIAVLLYGVFGLVGGVGLGLRRRWSLTVAAAWAVAVVYAASVASFAFHDPTFSQSGTTAGVIGACVATALIGALVVWSTRSVTRSALKDSSTLPTKS